MIILEYLNYLFNYLQDGSLPWEVRVAIGLFIMCSVLLLSIINIINYFLILIFFENKHVPLGQGHWQEWMNKYKIIKYIFTKYKATRVYFLIIEISLSLYIILFILYTCYQVFYSYVST